MPSELDYNLKKEILPFKKFILKLMSMSSIRCCNIFWFETINYLFYPQFKVSNMLSNAT